MARIIDFLRNTVTNEVTQSNGFNCSSILSMLRKNLTNAIQKNISTHAFSEHIHLLHKDD